MHSFELCCRAQEGLVKLPFGGGLADQDSGASGFSFRRAETEEERRDSGAFA